MLHKRMGLKKEDLAEVLLFAIIGLFAVFGFWSFVFYGVDFSRGPLFIFMSLLMPSICFLMCSLMYIFIIVPFFIDLYKGRKSSKDKEA